MECLNRNCNNIFKFRSNKKYCSRNCKQKEKDYRLNSRRRRQSPYIIYKKEFCEYCNFIPIHSCQLDVDHIDGNHENNNIDNLQTLCANCHRLKTHLNRDWGKNNK